MDLVLVSETETMSLVLCYASQIAVHYRLAEKKNISKLLRQDEAPIQKFSYLVKHGYLKYGKCTLRCSHGLLYYLHMTLASNYLIHTVQVAGCTRFALGKDAVIRSGKEEVNSM